MNTHFTKEGIQVALYAFPKILMSITSLASQITRKMQIKSTMRNYFTPPKMSIIKQKITNVNKNVEQSESSDIAGRNVKWHSHSLTIS